jgi:periplasmic divalent cation tolerance protein
MTDQPGGPPGDEASLLLTTVGSREAAFKMAHSLVEARVVACVSILPGLVSTYRWQGKVVDEDEVMLLIKVPVAGVQRARQAILAQHPYEVPELLALRATDVPPAYLAWLEANTA